MDEQKKQRYIKAPISIQHLYSAPESGALVSQIYEKYQLPPEKYLLYSQTIGDVILGFYTTTELPKLLETELGIDEATAIAIVEDLSDFLGPVYDRESGRLPAEPEPELSYEEKVQQAAAPAETFTKATPTWNVQKAEITPARNSAYTTNDNQETGTDLVEQLDDEPSETIAPMRTMEGDIQKIHGYGAYRDKYPTTPGSREVIHNSQQDEALQRTRPRLADTPQVAADPPPPTATSDAAHSDYR